MDINQIYPGMKVIPHASTYQATSDSHGSHYWARRQCSLDQVHMPKGYLIVCEIVTEDNGSKIVVCHSDGRRRSFGHTSSWRWLPFRASDLSPFTKNDLYFLKYKGR
jgi:hypothetical protein